LETIHVMAGALLNGAGQVLVARRPEHVHQGGRWEFPGGKLEPGEGRLAGLRRELREEIGVEVESARPLIAVTHDYPERRVHLDVWRVERWRGQPFGREGQAIEWLYLDQLQWRDFPPADLPVFQAMALPDRYLVTGDFVGDERTFLKRLAACLERTGIELFQLRVKSCPDSLLYSLCDKAVRVADKYSAKLLLNGDATLARRCGAAGVHLTSSALKGAFTRPLPTEFLGGASCHDSEELRRAVSLGANFAVLGAVRPTASHPGATPLGWKAFARLVAEVNLPVFALGGVGEADKATAWRHGGQGVAAISAFWTE